MYDIFVDYDIKRLSNRIRETRKSRSQQYKNYLKEPDRYPSEYQRYKSCTSQESLAEAINVSRQTINDWETGKSSPDMKNFIQLCSVFNCNADYLLDLIDTPATAPVSIAHFYSKVDTKIIEHGLKDEDYLDCLNFFMLPENCSALFNNVTITAWRNFWSNINLENIKNPLKDDVIKAYDEYSAITPFQEINEDTYKLFLENKFPEKKIIIKNGNKGNGYKIKSCFQAKTYESFFENNEFNYSLFIKYLVNNTFKALSHNALIESQKIKLSKIFIDLFTKYLES